MFLFLAVLSYWQSVCELGDFEVLALCVAGKQL